MSCLNSATSSPSTGASTSNSPETHMQGTDCTHKSATQAVFKQYTQQHSEVNKDPWTAEISGKISLVNEPLKNFFKSYIPYFTEYVDPRPRIEPLEVFAAIPTSGHETDKYSYLINGLRQLVSKFDDHRRPKFADGSKCAVPFPFKDWEEEHHYTLPDILMSMPGEGRDQNDYDDTWAKTWHRIGMVFEVKNVTDPINEDVPWLFVKPGATAAKALAQLAESARNLMLTHGMLFAFAVGIYDDRARIYRFDHAACVVSRSFPFKVTPWPLHELLWRLCTYEAPAGGLPTGSLVPRLLGEDPTLCRASDDDKALAAAKCEETGQHPLSKDEKEACRWVTAAKYDNDGKVTSSTRILLYRIRSLNPRLFSRATMVSEGYEEGTWKRLAVKDAWRQVARDREDAFYDQIRGSMQKRSWNNILEDYKFLHRNNKECQVPPLPFGPYKLGAKGPSDFPSDLEELLVEAELDPMIGELFGLARMSHGDDLGAREAGKLADSYARPAQFEFYHRTICRGSQDVIGGNTDSEHNERSHTRLVFETVGRPLSQFKSTKELIRGFRDAVHGHRQACRAGIIHRDISENNVMLSDDMMSSFVGFLLDFDHGFNWMEVLKRADWEVTEESWKRYVEEYDRNLPKRKHHSAPQKETPAMCAANQDDITEEAKAGPEGWGIRKKLEERTGTLSFMAIEILDTHVAHDVRHDLESFFWLLLWVVLRYTATTCDPPKEPYVSIFGAQTDSNSAWMKTSFLFRDMDWEVRDNKPLTTLVQKYKRLCYMSMRRPSAESDSGQAVPLTYEAVLALFDEAIIASDWPQDDRALPFKMPQATDTSATQGGSRASNSRGGAKRREAPIEEDPLSLPPHKRAHVYRRTERNPVPGGVDQGASEAPH